jgi:hypothetical protein
MVNSLFQNVNILRSHTTRRLTAVATIFVPAMLLLSFLIAPAAHAADNTRIQTIVTLLGSDDPRLRAGALNDLMDLKRADLPALRAAAISQSPLLPAQVAALRQGVTQIYLASERYRVDISIPGGFMGLHWSNANLRPTPDGVVVDELLPGFPAYRCLQPGDVMVAILAKQPIPLRSSADLVRTVMRMWPGDTLRLRILHLGAPRDVSMVLDFLPVDLNPTAIDPWIDDRTAKAQAYWNQEFSVIDPTAPAGSQASTSTP